MDKVTQSDKNITPYGGLNFIYEAVSRAGLDKFLDAQIGCRSLLAKYSYSDVVLSLLGNSLVQGSFISDLRTLKDKYSAQFFSKIPSADTVEYVCQELKSANIVKNKNGIEHELNYIPSLNASLVSLAIKTGQLKTGEQNYTLDYDNVVMENEKQDAKMSYKKTKGYHPGIAFIGRLPVHIENRNGNTPARFEQKQTLERCFDNLDKYQVKVTNFRADAASYQQKVFDLAEQHCKYFYIRMMDFDDIRYECGQIRDWKTVEINYVQKEVASIEYIPGKSKKAYRIVVTRHKRKDGQIDLLSKGAYTYQGIITNNEVLSEKKVIEFYNARGDAENSNRYLLNDFNLHHLPFPDMNTNTVYMYFMAMCAILFEWTKKILVGNKTKSITISMRVKAVCFHYITVASTFINHARKHLLKVFSSQEYQILKI